MSNYNELNTIIRQLDILEGRILNLETSGRLFASGIGRGGVNVYGGGAIRVEDGGSVDVYDGGNIEVYGTSSDPGTVTVGSQGTVTSDGPAEFTGVSSFGGDVSISGNLTVRGNISIQSGLIKSNALRNQMSGARTLESSTRFSLNGSFSDKVSATLTAPSWANTAVVYVGGTIQYDETGSQIGDNLPWGYARSRIMSSYSQETVIGPLGSTQGFYGTAQGFSAVVSNPTTIHAAIQARTVLNVPGNTYNQASMTMFAIFYR